MIISVSRRTSRWIGAVIAVVACTVHAHAAVRLSAIFGDHMVLQQQSDAPIWGWAEPGERIEIDADWLTQPLGTSAGDDGRWTVKLPTPEAGGPHTVVITGTSTITLTDVLIGEVWICSGQSNMEWPVSRLGEYTAPVVEYEQEIAATHGPQLRLFTVRRAHAINPLDDCQGQWAHCTPESVATFSAVAYYFGRKIQEDLNVPVGLVNASWGGTPAEAWTEYDALESSGLLPDPLGTVSALRADPRSVDAVNAARVLTWRAACEEIDLGLRDRWMETDVDDASWKTIEVPANWSNDELADFDGVVWHRTTFTLPHEWYGENLVLELGPIDDWDTTWINGTHVGEQFGGVVWNRPRVYEIPADVLTEGENTLTVRVVDTRGAGGIFGQADQLFLRLAAGEKTEKVPLAGQWRYARGPAFNQLPEQPELLQFGPRSCTALYNGMIAPIVPLAMRGAIWYQGESNRYDSVAYRELFPTMIRCWREQWGRGDFPFYFVQIAPFQYGPPGSDSNRATALLREAQMLAMRELNTGMVVTTDVGNPADIHPRNKKPVGERLAFWALANTYDRDDVAYCGPVFREMKIEGSRARLYFDHADDGLLVSGNVLEDFIIADAKRAEFVPARAVIEGNTIVVWSEKVTRPRAVRFGWGDVPKGSLLNSAGIPASPFRTDLPESD